MNYFDVIYCNEYAKENGKYGIIDVKENVDEYQLKDCKPFPYDMINNITFIFEGKKDDILADFQMPYFPWRLISTKLYGVLEPFDYNNDILFYPVKIRKDNELHEYYIMHFINKIDVIDKTRTVIDDLGIALKPKVIVEKLVGIHLFNYKEKNQNSFFWFAKFCQGF